MWPSGCAWLASSCNGARTRHTRKPLPTYVLAVAVSLSRWMAPPLVLGRLTSFYLYRVLPVCASLATSLQRFSPSVFACAIARFTMTVSWRLVPPWRLLFSHYDAFACWIELARTFPSSASPLTLQPHPREIAHVVAMRVRLRHCRGCPHRLFFE